MANTQAQTNSATFNIKERPAKTTVGDAQCDIAAGSGNVTVYAETFKATIPGSSLSEGEVTVGTENGTPVITTTGVIYAKHPSALEVPAPAATAEHETSPVQKDWFRAAKDTIASALAEYFPKTGPAVGDDTGNGWVCISKPSLWQGSAAPVTVAKFVGETDFNALEKAARNEKAGEKIQNVRIPGEKELDVNFNAVAELVKKTSDASKAVWMNNVTAFGLNAQGQKNPQHYRKYTSKSNNKFTGILFATLKV